MIRKKTDERENRIDRIQHLQKILALAEDEDQWDLILKEVNGVSGNNDRIRWASATREALFDVKSIHARNTRKRMHAAWRMFEIMQGEKKLADRERLQRRNWRHQAYKARRRQREAATSEEEVRLDGGSTSAISAAAM